MSSENQKKTKMNENLIKNVEKVDSENIENISIYKKNLKGLSIEEEKAIENLVFMSQSFKKDNRNFFNGNTFKEVILKNLQCKSCDDFLDIELVQLFIHCGYTGDYTKLFNYENRCKQKEEQVKDIKFNDITNKKKKKKKVFTCAFCQSKFTSKNGLSYHTNYVHSIEKSKIVKPFECPVNDCNRKYKNKNGLFYHMTHRHMNDVDNVEELFIESCKAKNV